MPLDEATHRLSRQLEPELRKLGDSDRSRADRGEMVGFDSVSRVATWETRRGDVIGRWYGEVVATYVPTDRILRWAWAGRTSLAALSHVDVIAQEGQSRGVPQLAMSVVGNLDESEAAILARLGVVVARGQGMKTQQLESEVRFIGLFDSARPRQGTPEPSRFSVPPPPVAPRVQSAPPPEVAAKVREPARALFVPVATAALHALGRAAPSFMQALFVVHVVAPAPPVLTLVVVDAGGALRSLEPPPDLVLAAARMVDADRQDGNGRWKKLAARITPKPDGGATLHVDVT